MSRDILDKIRGGSNSSDKSYRQGGARPRGTNPLNRDGTMSKCAICESIFHWAKDCQDGNKSERVNVASHEKEKSNERPGISESPNLKAGESVTAVTTKELSVFVSESFDSAIIGTACTSTVCGRKWLDRYVSSQEVGQQKEIVRNHNDVTFCFGDGRKSVSEESVIIPAKHAGLRELQI